MISGPHLPLLVCTTEQFGLGKATDADCSAPEQVIYRYVSTDGYGEGPARPCRPVRPIWRRATIKGRRVPLIVREERGVINRSVYFLATIDPTPGGPDSDQSDAAWNGRLVYRFGGGCGTSYGQGTPMTTVDEPEDADRGLRGRDRDVQHVPGAVQRRAVGRDRDDGQGTLHRGVRRAGAHDRRRRVGRFDPAAPHRPELSGSARRGGRHPPVPRCHHDRPGRHATAGCSIGSMRPRQGRRSRRSSAAAINGHAVAATCDFWVNCVPRRASARPTGCDPAIPKSELYDPVKKRNGLPLHAAGRQRQPVRSRPEDRLRPTGRSTTSACSTGSRR